MKYLLFIIFVALLFSSCADKNKMPPNIFPVNKMKQLVWDMEVADQSASEKFLLQKDSQRMEATSLYQQVFTKYKTNKKAFYNSFSYYETHPDQMKVLLDSVSNYGSRQKENVYKKAF